MSFGSSERIPNDWWLLMSTNQMQPLRLKLQAYWIIKYYESFSPPPMCRCECECEISWNETNEEKLFGSPNVSSWSHLWCTAHVPTFPMRFFFILLFNVCVPWVDLLPYASYFPSSNQCCFLFATCRDWLCSYGALFVLSLSYKRVYVDLSAYDVCTLLIQMIHTVN